MKKRKSFLCLAIITALCIVITAGCGATGGSAPESAATTAAATVTTAAGSSSAAPPEAAGGKISDKPVTLTLLTYSHPSYPFREDWLCYKLLEEATNVHLDVEAVIADSYNEKLNVKLASNNIPDITYMTDVNLSLKYGGEGAFVELAQNMDKLPDFQKWSASRQSLLSYYLGKEKKALRIPE